jgi:hypothetical protein
LLKRTGGPTGSSDAATTTHLGDWYANGIVRRPAHLVLCVSERTLLPVVMLASPAASIGARLAASVAEVLRALSVPEDRVQGEIREMDEYRTDKTANRQVLGSMNDFAWLLEAYLDHGDALLEASLRLADAPCSPLKMDRPKDITREVFGVSASRLRLVTKR